MIDSGQAVVGIAIPAGFAADLQRSRKPSIAVIIDGQDANSGTIALGYVSRILQDYTIDLVKERVRAGPSIAGGTGMKIPRRVASETRVWYNPNLKTTHFMVPGVVAMVLTMVISIIAGMAVVREREVGTLEQLLVTPIKPLELLLGKTIPFGIIGLWVMTYAMTFGVLWFGVPVRGSIVLLFAFTAVYLVTILGQGLFVSTISSTQQQSMFFTWFMNVFAILMSGILFPIENMPRSVQYITYLNPIRYYATALREILLKGSGIEYLWSEMAILALFGLVVFGLAAARFRKRVS
jgi:ABC-2 type transport system permease protein